MVATDGLHSYRGSMLHIVRQHAQSLGIKIILGIIVAVFVLWGVEGVVSGVNSQTTVAVIDGTPIEINAVARAEFNLRQVYQRNLGDRLTPEILAQFDLPTRALEGLVERRLLARQAQELGLVISDREINDVVLSNPSFFSNGAFDKEAYVRILRYSQLTPAEYESSLREDLQISRLQGLIVDEIAVAPEEARAEVLAREEKRTLAFVGFPKADFLAESQVDEEALASWYGENEERFREPEKVIAELLVYRAGDFGADIVVAEEDIAAAYAAGRESSFRQENEVRARHILKRLPPEANPAQKAAARAAMAEIVASLAAGADFATLAKEQSEDPGSGSNGGDLGFFGKGRMVPAFEEAAFALQAGEVSEVVESPFGLHLIRVEEVREERILELVEVRDRIDSDLRQKAAAVAAGDAAEADRKALAEGSSLTALAEARGLVVETPAPLARSDTFAGIGRSYPLMNAIFSLAPAEGTKAIQVGDAYVVAVLREKVASLIPALTEVRASVERGWRGEMASEMANAAAGDFLSQAAAAGSLTAAAAASDLNVAKSLPFSRTDRLVQPLGGTIEMRDAVFALPEEESLVDQVFSIDGDSFVVAIASREAPTEEALATQVEEAQTSMTAQRQRQVFSRYLEELRAAANIEVYAERLAALRPPG